MGTLTRSARCQVFHRDEVGPSYRFAGGPYFFKPLLAPLEASSVGFATHEAALAAAEAFEAEFAEEAYLPGECAVDSDWEAMSVSPATRDVRHEEEDALFV
jgi:hypothetical protein